MYSTIPNTQTRPKQRSTCITWSPHPNAIMQGAGEHRTRSAQRCISHSSVRVTKHSQHQPICKPQAIHRNTHAYERCIYECICTQIIRPDRFVLHASAHSLLMLSPLKAFKCHRSPRRQRGEAWGINGPRKKCKRPMRLMKRSNEWTQ